MAEAEAPPRGLLGSANAGHPQAPSFWAWPMAALSLVVRLVMLVPVVATFITAVALMIYGALETWRFVESLYFTDHPIERNEALLMAIEIVDLFLLATVVQVVAVGLLQLYFVRDIKLPKWLTIEDLDDLKSKLVGVTVTVLAVYFLGQAVVWTNGPDIAYLGAGVALVIAALTYFLRQIDK